VPVYPFVSSWLLLCLISLRRCRCRHHPMIMWQQIAGTLGLRALPSFYHPTSKLHTCAPPETNRPIRRMIVK
jgi:hypothetical protein